MKTLCSYFMFLLGIFLLPVSPTRADVDAMNGVEVSDHDLTKARTCLDAAWSMQSSLEINVAQNCISQKTDVCRRTSGEGTIFNYRDCVDYEAAIWFRVMDEYLTKLQVLLANADRAQQLEALSEAHDAWKNRQAQRDADCAYRISRWGEGSERIPEAYRCVRRAYGERAILYHDWYSGAKVRFVIE